MSNNFPVMLVQLLIHDPYSILLCLLVKRNCAVTYVSKSWNMCLQFAKHIRVSDPVHLCNKIPMTDDVI